MTQDKLLASGIGAKSHRSLITDLENGFHRLLSKLLGRGDFFPSSILFLFEWDVCKCCPEPVLDCTWGANKLFTGFTDL